MDLRGWFISIIGFSYGFACWLNAQTSDGVAGLIRFNNFLLDTFGFSIPFLEWLAENFTHVGVALIGILFLLFRGKLIWKFLQKILPIK